MKCSVVILNWNGEAMLRQYLPSVLTHTQLPEVEIVVADNGSTDGSLEFLQTQGVRIIVLDQNYGFAEGYNRAIAQVDSEYVVLLNSDVEVTPHWLDTGRKSHGHRQMARRKASLLRTGRPCLRGRSACQDNQRRLHPPV